MLELITYMTSGFGIFIGSTIILAILGNIIFWTLDRIPNIIKAFREWN